MRLPLAALALAAITWTAADASAERPPAYFHYMPWFETPDTNDGNRWGYHWTLENQNPDVVDRLGRRQIASHYYPKIGPYATGDDNVLEYHMLLMKLSGVEGIFLDWYGVQGSNGDVGSLLRDSNKVFDAAGRFGLDVAVVLEDRFARDDDDIVANVAFLRDNYFNQGHYLRVGTGNEPLLMNFGPASPGSPGRWPEILNTAGEPVEFLPLWFQSDAAGTAADGEFAWIREDPGQDNHLAKLQWYLDVVAGDIDRTIGSAYVGFDDFYVEGGVGDIIDFDIPYEDGQTLRQTLLLNEIFADNVDAVQLATFNDFGEGTMFEPTLERGYDSLAEVQRFTGVGLGESDLDLAFALYSLRKAFGNDVPRSLLLDEAAMALSDFDIVRAGGLIDRAAGLRGDADGDGDVDEGDFDLMLASFHTYVADYSRGDFDLSGFVDEVDFALLRDNYSAGPEAASRLSVPEPTIAMLLPTLLLLRRRSA